MARKNDWCTVHARLQDIDKDLPVRFTECYDMVAKYAPKPLTSAMHYAYAAEAYTGIRNCRNWLATTLPSYHGYHDEYSQYPKEMWVEFIAKTKPATLQKWIDAK